MRRMKAVFPLFIYLLVLVFFPAFSVSDAMPRKLTLMVYMCGSNLESQYGSASADYLEMTSVPLDPDVTVLVMMGGTSGWHLELGADSFAVMEISHRGARKVRSLEKMNMGDGETLASFLRFGMDYAPAEEYALILWDHGGGPLDGLCWDEQYAADHLSLPELAGALNTCGLKDRRLGWIGFDACLMSSMEVAFAMSPFADYIVSSQAEEPASGWNYAFLQGLGQDASPEETGRRIVDAYFEVQPDAARDLTLACLDLSAVNALSDRINIFFADLSGSLTVDTFADISRLRLHATGFGKSFEIGPGQSGYDLVDLVSLVECYASRSPEKADRVISAVHQAVVYQKSNLAQSCGISVYHPWRNRDKFRSAWHQAYPALGFCEEYTRYVAYYGSIMSGESLVRWDGLDRISAWLDAESQTSRITAELSPEQAENLAGARLVILARNLYDAADESFSLVYRSPEAVLEGTWLLSAYDERHLRAMDISGFTSLTGALSYRVTEDGTYLLPLWPYDAGGNRDDAPVWAEYTRDGNQLRLKHYLVFDEMTQAWTSRTDMNLKQYAGVTFRNEYRIPTTNTRGEMLSFDQWEVDAHTDTHMKARYDVNHPDFKLVFGNSSLLRAESLYAAFEITDTQGYQYMTAMVSLEESQAKEYAFSLQTPEEPVLLGEDPLQLDCRLIELPSADPSNSRILLNVSLRNTSSRNLVFKVSNVQLNGMDCSAFALSSQGTGSMFSSDWRSLAPGEIGSASLILQEQEIEPLVPDVVLQQIFFRLCMWEYADGGEIFEHEIPCTLETGIPLTAFYWETDILPPSWLVEEGRKAGALEKTAEKVLIDQDGLLIALRGVYLYERNMILHLHYENSSSKDFNFFLGRAQLDDQEASIGQTRDIRAVARNNRIMTYSLDLPLWKIPTGVYQILHQETFLDEYVVIKPSGDAQVDSHKLSFQVYCYDLNQPTVGTLFSDVVIASSEPLPLAEDTALFVPASDFSISPGKPLPAVTGISLLRKDIPYVPVFSPRVLSVKDPENEIISGGFYILFRKVSSDAELAAMNITNLISDDRGEMSLSFPDGQFWLLYEAIGDLAPGENGSASALFPDMLPVIRSSADTLCPGPFYVQINDRGQFQFDQIETHLIFGSASFPGAVLDTAIGSLSIELDPASGKASLLDYYQIDGANPALAQILTQQVFLVSSDMDAAGLLQFLTGDLAKDPHTLKQSQLLTENRLTLEMEPISDPKQYMVVFLYRTDAGDIRCTPPVPLE